MHQSLWIMRFFITIFMKLPASYFAIIPFRPLETLIATFHKLSNTLFSIIEAKINEDNFILINTYNSNT